MHKIKILINGLIGQLIKTYLKCGGYIFVNELEPSDNKKEKQLIVSLTSYGRRVKSVLPYVLHSLLSQTAKPDKIIVWLDNKNWSQLNLTKRLNFYRNKGIEFRFYDDIKSYKKLIPTLIEFPNDIIITVDDDIYYSNDLVENLYSNHLMEPKKIQCSIAHRPLFDAKGVILQYDKWIKDISNCNFGLIFPTGLGGILYPPNSLYKDVTNVELFKRLCPSTDDIWFWVMALNKETLTTVVLKKKDYNLDIFYQLFHKGSALNHVNVGENKNDEQLKAVFDYYKIDFNKLNF